VEVEGVEVEGVEGVEVEGVVEVEVGVEGVEVEVEVEVEEGVEVVVEVWVEERCASFDDEVAFVNEMFPPEGGIRYTSLAVWFLISPIPMILFSSLFISITRMVCCGLNLVFDISLGVP
jgi:hypothetical protein